MEKKKHYRKKKNIHIRFWLVLLAFLLETAIVIFLFIAPIILSFSIYYTLIPIIVLILLDFFIGLFIVNSKIETVFKQGWLACVLIFPYIGALVYLMFGHKVTTKRYLKSKNNIIKRSLNELLEKEEETCRLEDVKKINKHAYSVSHYLRTCGFPTYSNNEFEYFPSGELGFEKVKEELKKAKRFIFIEFFIIERGEMFDSIYEILKEKVKEGVEVYFIYDDFGTSSKISNWFYKEVRKNGINCYKFNKISPTMNVRQNVRDHRKIIVIDGVVGFTGGCNLADEYINKINRFGYWKDNFLMIKGKSVDTFTKTFIVFYFISSKIKLDFNKFSFDTHKDLDESNPMEGLLIPYTDMPYSNDALSRYMYLDMINKAENYVMLSTPYLIPDNELLTALENKARGGVRVVIITPGIPDKKLVYQVTRSYYTSLLIAGCEIYEYTPGFNHEKLMVVDDKIALSGTCNFDCRSFYLNFEDGIFIVNNKEILKMRDSLLNMVSVSRKQELDKYLKVNIFKRWLWSLLRIFSSLV